MVFSYLYLQNPFNSLHFKCKFITKLNYNKLFTNIKLLLHLLYFYTRYVNFNCLIFLEVSETNNKIRYLLFYIDNLSKDFEYIFESF